MTPTRRNFPGRARAASGLALASLLLLGSPAGAQECRVETSDFCVCCPPSECRAERAVCPGGAGGLVVLEAENPGCAVNPYDEARCQSGGMIASEQRSALAVYRNGGASRIDLSDAQIDELVRQLRRLSE